jgi:hypothetical protein
MQDAIRAVPHRRPAVMALPFQVIILAAIAPIQLVARMLKMIASQWESAAKPLAILAHVNSIFH